MFDKVQGNARGCLIFEPLFILPYSLYMTSVSVYMLELGVSTSQIGFITSMGLVLQIFTSLISGYLTDRMGRKRALLIFDIASWSTATLLWAVAQNVWFFVAAAVLNSMQRIPQTAWSCLLIEDTKAEDRPFVYNTLQMISVVSGLFAPLGGLLVSRYGMVDANRVMYLFAFISMTTLFLGRNAMTREPEIGIRKRNEASAFNLGEIARDYANVVRLVFTDVPLLLIFFVYILNSFQGTLRNTYFSIYLIQELHFNEAVISWLPAVTSVSMLLLLWLLMPRLRTEQANVYMAAGFLLQGAAMLLQILAQTEGWTLIIAGTVLFSIGTIITFPYLEAAVANVIQDEERAKIYSIFSVLILLFVSPSGVIGGWTYDLNPRLPFWLIFLSFMTSAILLFFYMRLLKRRSKGAFDGAPSAGL